MTIPKLSARVQVNRLILWHRSGNAELAGLLLTMPGYASDDLHASGGQEAGHL